MATEIAIRVSTEGADKAIKEVDRLGDSINKTKNSANEMSQSVDALDGVFNSFGVNAIGQFKSLQSSGSSLLKNFGTLRKKGIKGLITGFKGLKTAIASTGIGLLLTLLPDLINAIGNFMRGTDLAARSLNHLNNVMAKQSKLNSAALADFDQMATIEAIRGQTEQERIKRMDERLMLERKQLTQEAARLGQAVHLAKQIKDNEKREEALTKAREERDASNARIDQIDRERKIVAARLQAQIDKEEEARNAELEKEAEERARKAQERADAEKARLEELQLLRQQARQRELQEEQDFQAQLEQMEEEAFLRTLSDEEREVLAVQDKYFQLLTEAEQFGMDTAFLEEEQQLALQEIRDRFEQERRDKEQANSEIRQKELDAEFKQQADQAKAIAEANESLQDAKLDAIKGGIEAGKALAGENEQVQNAFFIAEKAVAAGEVIINAIREKAENAVQAQAFGSAFGAAAPAVTAAMLAKLNAGTNLRMGASLATLAATTFAKFKNGGGGASGSAGGGGVRAVSVGTPQQQTLTPITGESIDTTGVVQPVQAYVIGQDITNQQALDSELRLRSTL
jgi:peptidyl-tRNA hydrolase